VKRVSLLIAVLGLLLVACGDEGLLDGLGDRAQKAVVGTTTTTTAPDEDLSGGGEEGSVFAASVAWYNDGIADEAIGLPAYTIDQVWDRGNESGRFIQSSRAEIAVALPGVQFPAQIPAEVVSVTSQLVYLEDVASLDAGTSAAFGLWEAEPYSSDDGRVGVLRVGEDRGDVALGETLEEVVTSGLSLIWTDGRYRYELFCRASLPEELCREMMNSALPLRNLLLPSA
jgi:hypothetical protein